MKDLFSWLQKNERHLGGIVFLLGFITDLAAMYLLDASVLFVVFTVYLAVVSILVFIGHALTRWRESTFMWQRAVMVVVPLVAQYQLGNLLSWFLIFYAKDSSIEASWPFILLIALVFIGNEWFRRYRDRIAFVTVLLFFAAYMYALYAVPLVFFRIDTSTFLISTGIAFAVFMVYLTLLWIVGKDRMRHATLPIVGAVCGVIALVSGAFYTGVIPPLPLGLKDVGVYHDLSRGDDTYYLIRAGDQRPWWDPRPDIVLFFPTRPLYAFSSVSAPVRFGAELVHRWQVQNPTTGAWSTRTIVKYPLIGGREQGFRGYSQRDFYPEDAGRWRVRVETASGQVIGQKVFDAVMATSSVENIVEER